MRGFLFDENLPARLKFLPSLPISSISTIGPNPTDTEVWGFAVQHELVIVTKDADFSDRMILRQPPPVGGPSPFRESTATGLSHIARACLAAG